MLHKVKEWLYRYGPAELVSLLLTVVPAWLVFRATHQQLYTALAATWGGNIGYFGTILFLDVRQAKRVLQNKGGRYTNLTFYQNIRAMVVEFGVAEVLDSFLIRPALMYWMPIWLGNLTAGIIVAKFAADVTFYIPTVLCYEWSKRKEWREFKE